MPRQIFADEIERFLETLHGVASARVLTDPDGAVSNVYVTASSAAEGRGLRHGIVAALQSHFGIPIDEWRVRIAQLRTDVPVSEVPCFRVTRVEEAAAAGELAVTIKLGWTRGAEDRSATGRTHGRGDAAERPRALAAATIAAVRDALDVPHAQLALDRVGTATFLDRPVVLAAVSAAIGGRVRLYVGTALDEGPVRDAAGEPAITAALDAVTRWLVDAAFVAGGARPLHPGEGGGRRERLEAMRHFVLEAMSDRDAPSRLEERGALAPAAGQAAGGPSIGTASRVRSVDALPPRRFNLAPNGQPVADPPEGDAPAAGARAEGGATMSVQHDVSDAGTGAKTPRAVSVEEGFYRALIADGTPVHLRCRDGYEVGRAIVLDVGTHTLLVETADGPELFFKHAIISIRVLPKPAAQA
ncbi:MAG TPA: hypothetical protein VGZ23_01755 [bacterium]|nr:hypothetical protein [bacterium]